MTRTINETAREIVDAAMKIHIALGPGLLESVYLAVLARELERRGLLVEIQRTVTFTYDGMTFNQGLIIDLLVDGQVVVELKSVEKLAPVHHKQVLTYLRLMDLRLGLLINFGAALLKDGIHRIVNKFVDEGPSDEHRGVVEDRDNESDPKSRDHSHCPSDA